MELSDKTIQALQDRAAKVEENAATFYSAINAACPPSFQAGLSRKLDAIVNDNASLKSKLRRLQSLTSEARKPIESITPCRKGCSACCFIQVEIAEAEAEVIGEAISRSPVRLSPGFHTTHKDLLGRPDTPCPFLASGACSIYEVRPIVCRNHTVADADNLLCGFENMALAVAKDSRTVRIPLLQAGPIFEAYRHLNLSRKQAWADIRQFFPIPLRQ